MSDVKPSLLVVPLILAVAVAWVAKVYAMGWLTLLLALPYALVTLVHIIVHGLTLRRRALMTHRELTAILTSHILFLGAFLVQWDAGDGLGWLTITALFGQGPGSPSSTPPLWWPRNAATVNLLAFIPVAVSWAWIVLLRKKQPAG